LREVLFGNTKHLHILNNTSYDTWKFGRTQCLISWSSQEWDKLVEEKGC